MLLNGERMILNAWWLDSVEQPSGMSACFGKRFESCFQGSLGQLISEHIPAEIRVGYSHELAVCDLETKRHFEISFIAVPATEMLPASIMILIKDNEENIQAELSRKINEQRFRFALENANQGIWDWDVANDKVFLSDIWKSMLGFKPDEIANEFASWESRVHPDDLASAYENIQAHMEGKTDFYYIEHRLKHKNGHYVWILGRGRIIERNPDGSPKRFLGMHTDISNLKEIESRLSRSEEMLKKAQATAQIGHWYYEVKENRLHWSEETRNIHEVAENFQPSVEGALDFYHSDCRDVIREAFENLLATGTEFNLDLKIVTANGTIKYVRSIGKPEREREEIVAVSGVFQDISQEKENEMLLRDREAKLNEAQQIAAIGSWEYNPETLSFRWSSGMFHIWEIEDESIDAEKYLKSLHPEDTERVIRQFEKITRTKENCEFRHRIYSAKGNLKHVNIIARVKVDQDGKVSAVLGTTQDVTEKITYVNELIKAKERAEKASRSKMEFLSMMSHEMRTPLNAVMGMTHLLLQENPRDNQIENLETLKLSADNLLALITNLLDFNKIESGQIEFRNSELSLRPLVENICKTFNYNAREKGIELFCHVDDSLPDSLKGDDTRLTQILTNLISNAVKFTKAGQVDVHVELLEQTDVDYDILFRIVDTGIGISDENLKRIFSVFTQARSDTSRIYDGSGMGLAIARQLLELQGSSITVDSEEGKGSTFAFKLRFQKVARKQKQPPKVKTETPTEQDSLKGLRVLLAEDNRVNIRVATKFLEKWDITVEVALNGESAYRKVLENDYHLILMDLQMPEMNGLEATRLIRDIPDEKKANTPIIALTASALMETRQEVNEAGMNDYISKPFNPQELHRKIKKLTL